MDIAELNVLNELEDEENDILNNINQRYDVHQYGKICDDMKNKTGVLKILHINIRSAQKNFDAFLTFLEAFKIRDLDIIIFGETRSIRNINNYTIPGFQTYFNNSMNNQNDGVLIFIRDDITFNINHEVLPLTNVTISNISFKLNNVEFLIMPCYRSPSISDNLFLIDLESYLSNLGGDSKVEVFIGDINFDILNPSKGSTNEYLSLLSYLGFKSFINSYTRVTHESSTCLDHVYIRKKMDMNNFLFDAFVIDTDITDHFPICVSVSLDKDENSTEDNKKKNIILKFDNDKFGNVISTTQWDDVINLNDPELACKKFNDIFINIINECTTTRTVSFRKYKKIKPWITNGLIHSIKHRDKLKKLLIKDKNNVNLLQEYKDYRNQLNKLLLNTKNNYYTNQINENTNNLKKIYQIVAEASNEKNVKPASNLNILDSNDQQFPSDTEMANYCNKYYINIGSDMASRINEPITPLNILYPNLRDSMALNPVTNNEVILHISTLKNNTSPGMDRISSTLIKKYHNYIIDPLVHIINLIFSTGKVPSLYKVSVVTPIFKKGSKSNITNYRPISLISTFTKIFEKCLKCRLYDYLTSTNILNDRQYGFLRDVGTNDAMFELINNIKSSLDNGEKGIAVFLDLAKAFDTVPHGLLINALEQYGVRGVVLEVFKNYLMERRQVVKIRNVYSDPLEVKIGVPQGTVLGPLLFITYINSLLNLNIDGVTVSYADDTVLFFRDNSWEHVKNRVIKGLEKVKCWLDQNKLTLNTDKTFYIAFSMTDVNRPAFNCITINGSDLCIKETNTIKYLGITIDKNLKWTNHIQNLTNKIRSLLYKFYIIRRILPKKLLIQIYKSLIESILRYGILVWGGLYDNALRPLKIVQNFILRIIFYKDKLYSSDLLYSEDILSVRCLYYLSNCILCFKSKHKTFVSHCYQTRHNASRMMVVPFRRYDAGQRYASILAPKIYNLLPHDIRATTKCKSFISKCKSFIHRHRLYIDRLL